MTETRRPLAHTYYADQSAVTDPGEMARCLEILWDEWGLIEERQPSENDLQLLDLVAEVTRKGDSDEARRVYEVEPGLRIPTVVTTYGMASGGVPKVSLELGSRD
jgi:hypothetical protein